jgi:hypothetical protein
MISMVFHIVFYLAVLIGLLVPSPAEAIPAFARKYDLSCGSCHTKPPRLNPFGEAFHMAGFQIPSAQEGELRKKRQIGRVWSEADFLNIFSLRTTGNFLEATRGEKATLDLVFPHQIELYLAGTVTHSMSYFFVLEGTSREIIGSGPKRFEAPSEFGIGKEFFLMVNLSPSHSSHGKMAPWMIHGPMLMVGKIDPSTQFSYPTNRQVIGDLVGRTESSNLVVSTLAPYAFGAKFFGLTTGDGDAVEVTRQVLYNTTGDVGLDTHLMVGQILLQTGVMQGLAAGTADVNTQKDPYLMARVNFGTERYRSGSLSSLIYWGNDTAKVDGALIDWVRYGFAANIKARYLDLYGAVIWDRLSDLPAAGDPFDKTASGFTVEGDYLLSDLWFFSLRYDQMKAGGYLSQKADEAKVVSIQTRFYSRENVSVYLRDSLNVGEVTPNPLQHFRNRVALGVEFVF